ncbi:MAG: hypothetical protein U0791_11945 [Gemmataceae bacterium]
MRVLAAATLLAASLASVFAQDRKPKDEKHLDPIDTVVPKIDTDKTVKYDFDIAYVRAGRAGDKTHKRFFTDFSSPVVLEPGADLMLLHPDGSEDVLMKGGEGSITDPVVSLDGQWIFYTHIHNLKNASQWNPPRQGSDIYKIHAKTRKVVKLTNQRFMPNTGVANWSSDYRKAEPGKSYLETGVYNMGACPLPGGRLAFTSNRDGFRPAKGYPAICLQLFVMDDSDEDIADNAVPRNLEKIGHLNLAGALHPVLLADGRIMYSSLESQGARSDILWGIWTIHPDGTNWNPLVSAFDPGGAPNGFHFQAQLSNREIIVEEYYNQNNSGFGAYIKLPRPGYNPYDAGGGYSAKIGGEDKPDPASEMMKKMKPDGGYPAFAPAFMDSTRGWRYGRHDNGNPRYYKMPFMPLGSVSFTPFSHGFEGPADRSIRGDKDSPAVGKFTHPSAAPDNHLLTCYSPGPVNHQYSYPPELDGGIYLIKGGKPVESPSEMRLIKNDPNYNECWPRAVVPYKRIYGNEPRNIAHIPNDGKVSKHLPEGTPYALIGTSSFYKRESYPNGVIRGVTGTYGGKNDPWKGLDPFTSHGNGPPLNWHNQGADAGLYSNDDIHAVRILAMEPTTDRKGAISGRKYYNHAGERLRVLGEIPLRKFDGNDQPHDPDGVPDTSFLARIPADTGFTFQTLDKGGRVLNFAQTWHQLRPGEMRVDCGGCHAHSQRPTDFNKTAAAKPDYKMWDLVNSTPVLTAKAKDQSKQKWDVKDESGIRYVKHGPLNVEYWRDIRPILDNHCIDCHSTKPGKELKGNLNLDADDELVNRENLGKFPGTYFRLALDEGAKFGHKPAGWDSWGTPNASRYIRKFQSRRSLLVWKLHGERLDGFSNDDHPSERQPGSGKLFHKGEEIDLQKNKARADLDHLGERMPAGGSMLSDEHRRTIARWIDLGCPIDLDYDPRDPARRGYGWFTDEQRPTLTITSPMPGENASVDRLLIGAADYDGLDPAAFSVTADFEIDGMPAGKLLNGVGGLKFTNPSPGVWECKLAKPLARGGTLTVVVADHQGNRTRIERTFTVKGTKP